MTFETCRNNVVEFWLHSKVSGNHLSRAVTGCHGLSRAHFFPQLSCSCMCSYNACELVQELGLRTRAHTPPQRFFDDNLVICSGIPMLHFYSLGLGEVHTMSTSQISRIAGVWFHPTWPLWLKRQIKRGDKASLINLLLEKGTDRAQLGIGPVKGSSLPTGTSVQRQTILNRPRYIHCLFTKVMGHVSIHYNLPRNGHLLYIWLNSCPEVWGALLW